MGTSKGGNNELMRIPELPQRIFRGPLRRGLMTYEGYQRVPYRRVSDTLEDIVCNFKNGMRSSEESGDTCAGYNRPECCVECEPICLPVPSHV
jgi:hypothetical protein